MKLVDFKEVNVVYAKDQPEYLPLQAHIDCSGRMTCCWRLTLIERIQVLVFGKIWHQVLTFNSPLQPQLLLVENPLRDTDFSRKTAPKAEV